MKKKTIVNNLMIFQNFENKNIHNAIEFFKNLSFSKKFKI